MAKNHDNRRSNIPANNSSKKEMNKVNNGVFVYSDTLT